MLLLWNSSSGVSRYQSWLISIDRILQSDSVDFFFSFKQNLCKEFVVVHVVNVVEVVNVVNVVEVVDVVHVVDDVIVDEAFVVDGHRWGNHEEQIEGDNAMLKNHFDQPETRKYFCKKLELSRIILVQIKFQDTLVALSIYNCRHLLFDPSRAKT